MNILGIGLAIFAVYLSTYSIVDRICECKENCAKYNSYGQILSSNGEENENNGEEEKC